MEDRNAIASQPRYERNHLTLLAHSDEGFRNLAMLSSAGFLEGFSRGKANLDMELLSRHSEGVLALTGCLQSRFCRRIVEDRPDDARAHIDDLIGVFGAEQVYFELQRNGIAEQDKANEGIVKVARELGRPLVGTADVHYLTARGLRQPRRAALRADEVHRRRAEAELRHQRVLPQEPRGDGGRLRRVARGDPDDARDRRALRGRDGARQAAAAPLRDPGGDRARADAARAGERGACGALRRAGPRRGPGAPRVRARRDRGDGLRVLLPDRLGLRQVREGERDRGRARAAARPRARSSPTRSTSPTSTRSPTICCSSASSTPGASRCPTSTSTSRCGAASR